MQNLNVTYGLGGFDPSKPDNNVVATEVVDAPDIPASTDERVAALEDAVDTLILDSLGGL